MHSNDIAILALQETKYCHDTKEIRGKYTWFFSGRIFDDKKCHGVAIVVANDYVQFIYEHVPVDDRLMYMRFRLYNFLIFNIILYSFL